MVSSQRIIIWHLGYESISIWSKKYKHIFSMANFKRLTNKIKINWFLEQRIRGASVIILVLELTVKSDILLMDIGKTQE